MSHSKTYLKGALFYNASVDMVRFRSQLAGNDETRGRNFDEYFVSPGAVRPIREAKDEPLKD